VWAVDEKVQFLFTDFGFLTTARAAYFDSGILIAIRTFEVIAIAPIDNVEAIALAVTAGWATR